MADIGHHSWNPAFSNLYAFFAKSFRICINGMAGVVFLFSGGSAGGALGGIAEMVSTALSAVKVAS